MKYEEIKLEEVETSHTLGGVGEVVWGEGRGEGVDATLMSYTLKYSTVIFDIVEYIIMEWTKANEKRICRISAGYAGGYLS
jgi:hypothetical protein